MSQSELLPLTNRYHAAWAEYGTRIGQRQNVIQIYLTVAGVAFGFFFQKSDASRGMHDFLALAMAALTVVCTAMIAMHHRAMGGLTEFMRDCERAGAVELGHFCDPKSGQMSAFQRRQGLLDRGVVLAIFGCTDAVALYLARDGVAGGLFWSCVVLLLVSAVVLFHDIGK